MPLQTGAMPGNCLAEGVSDLGWLGGMAHSGDYQRIVDKHSPLHYHRSCLRGHRWLSPAASVRSEALKERIAKSWGAFLAGIPGCGWLGGGSDHERAVANLGNFGLRLTVVLPGSGAAADD